MASGGKAPDVLALLGRCRVSFLLLVWLFLSLRQVEREQNSRGQKPSRMEGGSEPADGRVQGGVGSRGAGAQTG